jgi:hypothetical protein
MQRGLRLTNKGEAARSGQSRGDRTGELEAELCDLAEGEAVFWKAADCSEESNESNLEDILAFESVGSGLSLFEGLEHNGLKLPAPNELDERESGRKVIEVLRALMRLRIFLVGFEHMSAREFYSTLYHQTLWEGCYVNKRHPGAMTIIDVSHRLSRSDIVQRLEDMKESESVH